MNLFSLSYLFLFLSNNIIIVVITFRVHQGNSDSEFTRFGESNPRLGVGYNQLVLPDEPTLFP